MNHSGFFYSIKNKKAQGNTKNYFHNQEIKHPYLTHFVFYLK